MSTCIYVHVVNIKVWISLRIVSLFALGTIFTHDLKGIRPSGKYRDIRPIYLVLWQWSCINSKICSKTFIDLH